ncbi:MAG: Biopolymer transport protein ExbD/TolR [Verrucomicrobiota bacterium]|jgi:biopolymer transport protein ExbD
MKLRKRQEPATVAFQIAPMVDILLVLLCFFVITWSLARKENELDVRLPAADASHESNPVINQAVLNVKADGTVIFDRKPISQSALLERLMDLAAISPDYAIILRGDVETSFDNIMRVLNTCQKAKIWNISFSALNGAPAQP